MKIQLLFNLIFLFVAKGLSETVTITPSNLVKKNPGENCKLQWVISGTFSSYTIVYWRPGISRNLGLNTDTVYDSAKGTIRLYIWGVQIQDAGYYNLTLNTGSQPSPKSSAILFVYGSFVFKFNNLSGKTQFTEGDVIEVSFSATSSFTPQGFQPKMYYFWQGPNEYLQNTSSGPAITLNGDLVAGYSLKNNGQILSIDTAQMTFSGSTIYYQVQEEGSLFKSGLYSLSYTLSHRPFLYNVYPVSRKWNSPSSFGSTSFQFSFYSNPPLSSFSNWSFVNTSGYQHNIPLSTNLTTSSYTYISVPLSAKYGLYGNLTMTITNTFGSKSVTYQVIPPGVPDMPGDFKVQYVTHSAVSLQWRCGWPNGEPQVVTVTLTNIANNTIVETLKTVFSNTLGYNSLFSSTFQSIVTPDTDYIASIWSSNLYGRSSIATLTVRTPVKPMFSVSYEDISFTESTAIVNVETSVVGVWLNVSCCVEAKDQCVKQTMTLLTQQNQIVIDPIPTGDDYVFEFLLFNRTFSSTYNLALIKGLKKSRNAGCETVIRVQSSCSQCNSPTVLGL